MRRNHHPATEYAHFNLERAIPIEYGNLNPAVIAQAFRSRT